MTKRNKFGFDPVSPEAKPSRARSVGPMGAAVREAAESLTEATEAKVAQRRQNAEDARQFHTAQDEGRLLHAVPLSEIALDDLPRDRLELELVAASDEMEELKASIRLRGQKEPAELYRDASGTLQLKKGWRRYTALSQLLSETGDAQFGVLLARIDGHADNRLSLYVDMVEENTVREDLTFAEMAQVAITAAQDDAIDEVDPDAMVARLYGALHKMKRSYIRSFVFLLSVLEGDLPFPKQVARNLGVDVARCLRTSGQADALRKALVACGSVEDQTRVLTAFVDGAKSDNKKAKKKAGAREKFEFHVGELKVTARRGECRIVSADDFASVPRHVLEKAVKAFEDELRNSNPRVTAL